MPSTRYTVRLPEALDTAVQAYLRTAGTPFAVLIRQALAAYIADTLPTRLPTPADRTPTEMPTPADSADRLRDVQTQLADLTTRVKVIEEILTQWPQLADLSADRSADQVPTARRQDADRPADNMPTPADKDADTLPTGADTPRRTGRPSSPLRSQILDLLRDHPEGLRAEEIRVYVHARRPIGDLLQGMRKGGVIRAQGRGPARRYVLGG
jgi:hypothetical protein